MFAVIGQTRCKDGRDDAIKYSVIDTSDNTVEWYFASQLQALRKAGLYIYGVSDSGVTADALFYVDCDKLEHLKHVIAVRSRSGRAVDYISEGTVYRLRTICKKPVKRGDVFRLGTSSMVCRRGGRVVKYSNGLVTILSDELYAQFKHHGL